MRYLTVLIALCLSVVSFASETPCLDPLACNFMEEGECDFCSCGDPISGYSITVEEFAIDAAPGITTYRFYLNLENPTDFLSAIYGASTNPLSLVSTDGFYNSMFGGVTGGNINPAFFPFFPDLSADSWVTIGIDSHPIGSEAEIGTFESEAQPWIGVFDYYSELSGQNVFINHLSQYGGAWYITNGSINGFSNDESQRVLFLQLGTSGSISGTVNAQIFPDGNGNDELFKSFSFDGLGTFSAENESEYGMGNACGCTDEDADNFDFLAEYDDGGCLNFGCLDVLACNYDVSVNADDGSCVFPANFLNCAGDCLNDGDADGVCDEFEIAGCQDAVACNYNASATDGGVSCEYLIGPCAECSGTSDDGTGSVVENDQDNDGVCDGSEVIGCQDDTACNYNSNATDSSACTYATGCDYCSGDDDGTGEVLDGDVDGDGICDEDEILGCQDFTACNYDSSATDTDGSCEYCCGEGTSWDLITQMCIVNQSALISACGEGTQWNDSLQICVVDVSALMVACGEGTYWDEIDGVCLTIETCKDDLTGDGVVGIDDLLELLSSFGTMCEGPETVEFSCGDPMNYHGYDYATVQIGEQCWFAENLRTELYQNGDSIPGDLSNEDWFNTMLGAQATYNNDSASLVSYGRLYNWNAATDARYLCPSNWHVPADWEWQQLTDNLGGEPGSYPQVSNQLKSSTLNSPSWDGDNSSGFSAIPAGIRDGSVSGYSGGNQNANFWSSSNWGTSGWRRILYSMNGAVYRGYNSMAHGLSVRCLKDTE